MIEVPTALREGLLAADRERVIGGAMVMAVELPSVVGRDKLLLMAGALSVCLAGVSAGC